MWLLFLCRYNGILQCLKYVIVDLLVKHILIVVVYSIIDGRMLLAMMVSTEPNKLLTLFNTFFGLQKRFSKIWPKDVLGILL